MWPAIPPATWRRLRRWHDAETIIRQIRERDPNQCETWEYLGTILLERDLLDAAVVCFSKAILIDAGRAKLHFFLGNAFLKQKAFNRAAASYKQAIRIDAEFYEAFNNLGSSLTWLGNPTAALACYRKAISLAPGSAEPYVNMANLMSQTGRSAEALLFYESALERRPDCVPALINLARHHYEQQEYGRAKACLKSALKISPSNVKAWHLFGNILRAVGKTKPAIALFKRALRINPKAAGVHISLGNAHKAARSIDAAIAAYRQALECHPQSKVALNNLAVALWDLGETQAAIDCFDSILAVDDDFAVHTKKAMVIPNIHPSDEAIDTARSQFEKQLDALASSGRTISDPSRQIGLSHFIVALHGREDEKRIRQKLFNFYRQTCPELSWTSPFLKTTRSGGRIRIGMVCNYFWDHTIGRLYRGIVEHLDKTRFEIVVFRFDHRDDETARAINAAADQVVHLQKDLKKDRMRIAEHQLEVLFYPEIGMDPLTYYLSFARLAPVQCKKGFPITSGVPTVDFFISHEASEPPNGQDYYTETLIRLKSPGYYYHRPSRPALIPQRCEYGLPAYGKLYACLQSPFKIHPRHDAVIAQILRKDKDGILLLLDGLYPNWKAQLIERFNQTLGDVVDRIVFLPLLPREKFISLFLIADAVIDSIYFSGGNTSLECFAMGVPVVTWPSPMLPGRLTYGFYRQMGVMDCVAADLENYADLAIRLANDVAWKRSISRSIEARAHILFENAENVRELEGFLERAVADVLPEDKQY